MIAFLESAACHDDPLIVHVIEQTFSQIVT
jgi:hypothetical protein